jgi:hypothetical protein
MGDYHRQAASQTIPGGTPAVGWSVCVVIESEDQMRSKKRGPWKLTSWVSSLIVAPGHDPWERGACLANLIVSLGVLIIMTWLIAQL